MNPKPTWWHALGTAVAVAAGICGLAILAFTVLAAMAMGTYGSNK